MMGRDLLSLNLVDRNAPSTDLRDNTSTCWSEWEAFKNACGCSDEGLFADPLGRARPKRLRCLVFSFAVQLLVVGLWVLHSVTSESELPPPHVVKTFLTVVPMAPSPPPPPPASVASRASNAKIASPRAVVAPPMRLAELAPVAIPVTTMGSVDLAELGGYTFDHGVDEGVPGGVVGGLVGGLGEAPAVSSPATAEPTIYVVSGELERPNKLVHIDPVYPGIASVARVEGLVILEATIDGEGNVENVRVVRSIPLLDAAALDAVRSWKYEPTIIGGKPVPIQMTVTVKFALA